MIVVFDSWRKRRRHPELGSWVSNVRSRHRFSRPGEASSRIHRDRTAFPAQARRLPARGRQASGRGCLPPSACDRWAGRVGRNPRRVQRTV